MKKRQIVLITAALVLLSGILLAFNNKTKETSCAESEQCCEKKQDKEPGGMLWESMSGQFFSASGQ